MLHRLTYLLLLLALPISLKAATQPYVGFTANELQKIASLSINSRITATDPGNRYVSNQEIAAFGKSLFFDKRLSGDGKVSCATCHDSQQNWSLPVSLATVRENSLQRHIPSLWNVAYNRWFFWDGRADSLWSQAIEALEDTDDMRNDRTALVRLLLSDPELLTTYTRTIGEIPKQLTLNNLPEHAKPNNPKQQTPQDQQQAWENLQPEIQNSITQVSVNLMKAIAAFEVTLQTPPTRFDQFAKDLITQNDTTKLSATEEKGLRLFIGKANCINCHFGSQFSDGEFHQIFFDENPALAKDKGRYDAIPLLLNNPFNRQGLYADNVGTSRKTLAYLSHNANLRTAFRTPSLRNVGQTAHYMHDGRFSNLEEVIEHYNTIESSNGSHRHETLLQPLNLSQEEKTHLLAFLKTLNSPQTVP